MLAALADGGWIDAAARDDMTTAYVHLRMIEHCLQMVADAQTHTLPTDPEELATVARMAGYAGTEQFGTALLATLTTVRDRYAALFEAAPTLAAGSGSLVFTGDTTIPTRSRR
jgi:glutamate-ammonia-ligase adenylyltransferase